jgi:hypothetical protein
VEAQVEVWHPARQDSGQRKEICEEETPPRANYHQKTLGGGKTMVVLEVASATAMHWSA